MCTALLNMAIRGIVGNETRHTSVLISLQQNADVAFPTIGAQVEGGLCKNDIAKSGLREQREVRNVNQLASGFR